MNKTLLVLALSWITGCATSKYTSAKAADPNNPLGEAADTFTQHLFDDELPVLNQAISELPPEVQALVQGAYVALEQAVQQAEAKGIGVLQSGASKVVDKKVEALKSLADALHVAIHVPDVKPVDPNGAIVPMQP